MAADDLAGQENALRQVTSLRLRQASRAFRQLLQCILGQAAERNRAIPTMPESALVVSTIYP